MVELHLTTVMFLIFIITQRLGEFYISRRNTAALLARAAVEHGRWHYIYMVTLHFMWVVCIFLAGHIEQINLFWLAIFAMLQVFRFWILISLGDRWTSRIIVLNEPLVSSGPYHYFRHPHYMMAAAEIFVAPMVLGLWELALIFSVLNAILLFIRIREEEKALAHLR